MVAVPQTLEINDHSTGRVVTAALLRETAKQIEIALQTTKPENLNYVNIARNIKNNHNFADIRENTIRGKVLHLHFPIKKITEGFTPQQLLEKALKDNPRYLYPEKFERALKLLNRQGMSINRTAIAVDLPFMTLSAMLKRAGAQKITTAELGLRIAKGKGASLSNKTYNRYFSIETVKIVAEALNRNNLDREKTIAELSNTIGAEKTRKCLVLVFPQYLLVRGIDFCVRKYKKWLDTKPKSVNAKNQEVLEQNIKENEKHNKFGRFVRAIQIITKYVDEKTRTNEEIRNRDLFLKIVREILTGRSAMFIGYYYRIPEEAVIETRKIMIDSFFPKIGKKEFDPVVKTYLNRTKFYDTLILEWASKRFWPIIKNRTNIPVSTRDEMKTVFKETMQRYSPWPKEPTISRRTLLRRIKPR